MQKKPLSKSEIARMGGLARKRALSNGARRAIAQRGGSARWRVVDDPPRRPQAVIADMLNQIAKTRRRYTLFYEEGRAWFAETGGVSEQQWCACIEDEQKRFGYSPTKICGVFDLGHPLAEDIMEDVCSTGNDTEASMFDKQAWL